MRLKAVTTDLPLEPDKPISFGLHDFCMACESCAKYCPAGAVPKGEPTEERPSPIYNNAGFRKWWINAEKCLIFWGINKKKVAQLRGALYCGLSVDQADEPVS